jgi:transglutaminase-like putative cysteine protease
MDERTGTVGCRLDFEVTEAATIVLQLAVARADGVEVSERIEVVDNDVPSTARELPGPGGSRQHLVHAGPGRLAIAYDARVGAASAGVPEPVTDPQRIAALRPSRYCPSDRMAGYALRRFGGLPSTTDKVRAICRYVREQVGYEAGASGPETDAVDTLLTARGVCRDFAHLVAALCRAVDVPARIAAVYAPGLSPMDFHAVVETDIDGGWYVWDATRLAPRATLIRIATGRDAADIAFATVLSGRTELSTVDITATAPGDLPVDDHETLVSLG